MAKPTLAPSGTRKPLSDEINEATRKPHTNLNRLITARLPLALPPQAITPMLYGHGLFYFAHVYLAFETLWLSFLHSTPTTTPTLELLSTEFPPSDPDPVRCVQPSATPDGDYRCRRASASRRVQAFLEHLLLPGLMRSERLKEDLGYLTGLSAAELGRRLEHPEGKRATEFTAHIRSAVLDKPHVLIAYAWVMYMAIFSGGRWMRTQMLLAGADFWSQPGARAKASMSGRKARKTVGMEFFYFKGSEDGEDIKHEFKRRFAELDQLLTPSERQEIIFEALQIFHFNTMMVEELDGLYGQHASLTELPFHDNSDRPPTKHATEKILSSTFRIREPISWVVRLMGEGTSPPEKKTGTLMAMLATIAAVLSVCLWFLLSRTPF